MKIKGFKSFQCAKLDTPDRQSEDAVMSEPEAFDNGYVVGIADGAGGEGVFASEWASTLLEKLSSQPMCFETSAEIDKWLNGFYQHFIDEHKEKAKDDNFLKIKFSREGSLSTLCAAWVVETTMKWMSYGDSCLFLLRDNDLQCYPERYQDDLNHFSGSTDLISTVNVLQDSAFQKGEVELKEGDVLLLATDAMSQFLILQQKLAVPEAEKELSNLLSKAGNPLATTVTGVLDSIQKKPDPLKQFMNLKEDDEFKDYCLYLRSKKALLPDDYSLSIVQL